MTVNHKGAIAGKPGAYKECDSLEEKRKSPAAIRVATGLFYPP